MKKPLKKINRYSALPALLYYAQHGYCEEKEVDIQVLKRNFGKLKREHLYNCKNIKNRDRGNLWC